MPIKTFSITLCCLLALVLTGAAQAHNLWLNPDNHYPAVGETVTIAIGWGHKYGADRSDESVRADRVAEIWALDPDGRTIALAPEEGPAFKLKVDKAGVYQVAARIKPGVFTTTPQGRKWADKKGVENPIKCTAFKIEAQTIVVAGDGDRNPQAGTGLPLELVPLANPARLTAGSELSVRVLFRGQPLAGMPVRAVFAGYAETAPKEKPFAVEAVTDDKGEATLVLDRAAYWLIHLSHTIAHPEPDRCDDDRYNTAFTLQVR
ncbi:DUF4198 domain-containing protein [Desulfatitalea alkaliphila]|uniref:DUF4198 domain-containing protein n=1 Tax=Desulfatitalea alkaliphila TaxID=2929485 RepID=A0AA41QZM6_9BACT|nr:DUF4198 domain-containing protein [Desulfatitalea alkaliphila]MCJ8499323.1 DUF4198 domain-containing protein [Desulfatitalea alkaliphila]